MLSARIVAASLSGAVLSTSLLCAEDLSQYRQFHFGMDLPAVVKQTGLKASDAKVIHQRPAVIQELEWQPRNSSELSGGADSVKEIRFSFYNGALSQMAINYDRYKTEGLTAEDFIEAISTAYGTATKPAGEIVFPSIFDESVKILARWENAEYSFNLVRSSYQSSFGMVVFSKRLDTLAKVAATEARLLDQQDAPRREMERNKREAEELRLQQVTARQASKRSFRP